MSDPLSVVKTGQSLYTVVQKPLGKLWQWVRVCVFKFRNRKPPLTEAKANQVSTSVLGGDVPTAISFRNMNTKHILIAALRRSSEKDFDWKVFLLEQLGSTFQAVWKSEMLVSFTKCQIEVQDINSDGNCEVIYEDQSFGTGGGSRSVYVYFPESKKLHSLTESLNWQDLSGPVSPEVKIEPEGDSKLVSQIERVASKRGFLNPLRKSISTSLNLPLSGGTKKMGSFHREKSKPIGTRDLHAFSPQWWQQCAPPTECGSLFLRVCL
jgi:hypothetical protein